MPQEHLQSKELESKSDEVEYLRIATGLPGGSLDSGLMSARVKTGKWNPWQCVCPWEAGVPAGSGLTETSMCSGTGTDFFWLKNKYSDSSSNQPQLVWLYQSCPGTPMKAKFQLSSRQASSAWKHVSVAGRDTNAVRGQNEQHRLCSAAYSTWRDAESAPGLNCQKHKMISGASSCWSFFGFLISPFCV